jgi:acyl-[acyl-carrier-protein] desaturase
MESLSNQIRSFAMPGTGIPGFAEHARQIANEGIYDLSVHHDRIIEPLVTKQWAVDKVQGLSAAAEQARESLLKHVERLGKVANRMRERRQEAAE